MQNATHGALVYYLIKYGKLVEESCRTYFDQLLSGLSYLHNKGYVHRDLKPDNLLLDEHYNLLIADFGHHTLLSGKLNDGKLRSLNIGTDVYNPPEIRKAKEYAGEPMDIFMAGVVLFIMATGVPPFKCGANNMDDFYKHLMNGGNPSLFWKTHFQCHPSTRDLSKPLIELITWMLSEDPSKRPTIQEIVKSEWCRGEATMFSQVQDQFEAHGKAALEKQKKHISTAKQRIIKAKKKTGLPSPHMQDHQRGGEIPSKEIVDMITSGQEELKATINKLEALKSVTEFDNSGNSLFHSYFSGLSPVDLFKAVAVVAGNQDNDVILEPENCQITADMPSMSDSVKIIMRVCRGPHDTSVLQFFKDYGTYVDFNDKVNEIKDELNDIEMQLIGCDESTEDTK